MPARAKKIEGSWARLRRDHLLVFEPSRRTPDEGVVTTVHDLTLCESFPEVVITKQAQPSLAKMLGYYVGTIVVGRLEWVRPGNCAVLRGVDQEVQDRAAAWWREEHGRGEDHGV